MRENPQWILGILSLSCSDAFLERGEGVAEPPKKSRERPGVVIVSIATNA
jgi:hypothetical protein